MTTVPVLIALSAILLISWAIFARRRAGHRYPPGPKGLPVLRNAFDVPTQDGWRVFRDWSRRYGSDVVHAEALGSHIVVLNSLKSAKDLLEERPNIYSDKEQSVMFLELCGWWRSWVMLPYGNSWREHRKLFHQSFRPQNVSQYHPQHVLAQRRLLQLMLDHPKDFSENIRFAIGSSILKAVYAVDATPGDLHLRVVENGMETVQHVLHAGVFLVDIFPILKHVPIWFPGAGFKRRAAGYKKLVDEMFKAPYYEYKSAFKEGTAHPCFVGELLSEAEEDTPERDDIFMNVAGTGYGAGIDTTYTAMMVFVLAMVLYPETQSAAQEELDRVLGRDRLPEFADQDSLPQVVALIYEVLRWNPPLPLATPHRAMSEDHYQGYYIPARSVVLENVWAIMHDENVYPNPDTFNPHRFLTYDGKLRDDVPFPDDVFGTGRRSCPGRYFAMDSLFLLISGILATFTIEKALGGDGEPIEVRAEFEPHFFSPPKPFKAVFKPRSAEAKRLIQSCAILAHDG
ncbi:cytochrome P450 [Phanerochaete sordida]|uniref:Cytochrome P450 n=1 Tax=Phanerochaete sordida TaxID=48140 RepID=A0A9P3GN63_9APHY|nr:cytochrome P450 [Phanerochaete sordida]